MTPTDPARELAELCTRLNVNDGTRGDEFLATQFDVDAWSTEFLIILSCIVERADFLIAIVNDLELDSDFKQEASSHIQSIKNVFNLNALSNNWNGYAIKHLGAHNVQPLKMLSPMVRQKVSYPKLTDEELEDLLSDVDQLSAWLNEHQTKEQDFIRQAILDGLTRFRFRLERVGWVGWGYTLDSLRDVIGAYMALERGLPPEGKDPVAKAVLKKVGAFVRDFYEKTKFAKDIVDTGDFMLRAYGALALVTHSSAVVGLIASGQ
jgi:hypothetical protein